MASEASRPVRWRILGACLGEKYSLHWGGEPWWGGGGVLARESQMGIPSHTFGRLEFLSTFESRGLSRVLGARSAWSRNWLEPKGGVFLSQKSFLREIALWTRWSGSISLRTCGRSSHRKWDLEPRLGWTRVDQVSDAHGVQGAVQTNRYVGLVGLWHDAEVPVWEPSEPLMRLRGSSCRLSWGRAFEPAPEPLLLGGAVV